MKQQLGKQIRALREKRGITTYQLQMRGVHPNLSKSIEEARTNYTIESLLDYLEKSGLRLLVVEDDTFRRHMPEMFC